MTELIIPRTRITFRETTYSLNTICLETPQSWIHSGIIEKLKHQAGDLKGYYKVSIKPYRKPRSTGPNSQNNHFHGNVRQICEATGNTMEQAKEGIKQRAMNEMGYPSTEVLNSIIPKSESTCNSTEASLLIDMTQLVASELGIHLVDKAW